MRPLCNLVTCMVRFSFASYCPINFCLQTPCEEAQAEAYAVIEDAVNNAVTPIELDDLLGSVRKRIAIKFPWMACAIDVESRAEDDALVTIGFLLHSNLIEYQNSLLPRYTQ